VQSTLPSLQPQPLQLSPEGTPLPFGNVCPATSQEPPSSTPSGSCEMHGSSGKREHTPSDSSTNSAQTTGSQPISVQAMLALAKSGDLVVDNPIVQITSVAPGRRLGHLSLSVTTFAAMFAPYTYLAARLEQVAGFGSTGVATALAGFGTAGQAGQALATQLADRAPLRATLLIVVTVALAGVCLSAVHENPFLLAMLLGVWGAAHTAAVTLCQVRVTLTGDGAPAFAMSMNISSANLGIALGAVFGGWGVERMGVDAMSWGAASRVVVIASLAGLTHALAERDRPKQVVSFAANPWSTSLQAGGHFHGTGWSTQSEMEHPLHQGRVRLLEDAPLGHWEGQRAARLRGRALAKARDERERSRREDQAVRL
jgi:hypothetical protein